MSTKTATKHSVEIKTLKGPISVTYKKDGAEIHARALQFDLIGVGRTRARALKELQEIFADYAEEVLNTRGKVRFFNPSNPDEWENPDKELFNVVFVLVRKGKPLPVSPMLDSIRDLRPIRDAVETIQLQPYSYA